MPLFESGLLFLILGVGGGEHDDLRVFRHDAIYMRQTPSVCRGRMMNLEDLLADLSIVEKNPPTDSEVLEGVLLYQIRDTVQRKKKHGQNIDDELFIAAHVRRSAIKSTIARTENITPEDPPKVVLRIVKDIHTLVETTFVAQEEEILLELQHGALRIYLDKVRERTRQRMAHSTTGLAIDGARIRVGPGGTAGLRGIFATEDIEPGTPVSVFPADAVCVETPVGLDKLTQKNTTAVFGAESDHLSDEERYNIITEFGIETGDEAVALIAGNPENCDDLENVAHLVNDGAFTEDVVEYHGLHLGMKPTRTQVRNMVARYYRGAVERGVNARFEMTFAHAPVLTTIEHVKKGDEITVCYGLAFWLKKMLRGATAEDVIDLLDDALDVNTIWGLCRVLGTNISKYQQRHYEPETLIEPGAPIPHLPLQKS